LDSSKPFGVGANSEDIFLAKLSADLGGNGGEAVETHQLGVNRLGQAVVGTHTDSTDLDVTIGGSTLNGSVDMYVAILADDGASIVASRLFGGSGSEGLSVDSAGRVVDWWRHQARRVVNPGCGGQEQVAIGRSGARMRWASDLSCP
jgi:hypothetical protein